MEMKFMGMGFLEILAIAVAVLLLAGVVWIGVKMIRRMRSEN